MRLSASEKYEIIQEVTTSEIGVKRTLESFGIFILLSLAKQLLLYFFFFVEARLFE